MKVEIIKYNNRKLYLKHKGCYTNLQDMLNLIKTGVDIKVIEHDTKKDITFYCYAQALTLIKNLRTEDIHLRILKGLMENILNNKEAKWKNIQFYLFYLSQPFFS